MVGLCFLMAKIQNRTNIETLNRMIEERREGLSDEISLALSDVSGNYQPSRDMIEYQKLISLRDGGLEELRQKLGYNELPVYDKDTLLELAKPEEERRGIWVYVCDRDVIE